MPFTFQHRKLKDREEKAEQRKELEKEKILKEYDTLINSLGENAKLLIYQEIDKITDFNSIELFKIFINLLNEIPKTNLNEFPIST